MTSTPRAEWPDACILVIDDEPLICRVLEQVLQAHGYERIATFTDPLAALERYDELRPDLLLLDLHMPQLDGTGVLHQVVQRPVEQRAPVIIMTGGGRLEDTHRTLGLGAADFLHKPVDTTELLLRVRHQLRERRLRQELARQNERLEALVEERAGELALLSRVLDEMPLPAVVLTPDHRVRFANSRASELLPDEGAGLLAAIPDPHDRDQVATKLGEASAEPCEHTVRIVGSQGQRRRARVEIQQAEDELITVLLHDIEEQERAREALDRALSRERASVERMRALEELRTNFLTAVSHELRTPLTVVLGLAEILHRHDGELEEARREDLLERLEDNAKELGELLDDLLDLNRLAAGSRTVMTEQHELSALVLEALEEVDADQHPVEVDAEPCDVKVEEVTIRRVVANLVRNATIHTPPGTPIRVELRRADDAARIAVIDRGPGVPDELKARIFDRFEQGTSVPSHKPGTGIGLALVKGFVELHGGQAWVQDTPGGGATFVVELPAANGVGRSHIRTSQGG